MRQWHDEAVLVKRQRLATQPRRASTALAGQGKPRPAETVAESLAAPSALEAMGLWP